MSRRGVRNRVECVEDKMVVDCQVIQDGEVEQVVSPSRCALRGFPLSSPSCDTCLCYLSLKGILGEQGGTGSLRQSRIDVSKVRGEGEARGRGDESSE